METARLDRSLPDYPARTTLRRGTGDQSANRQAMQAADMARPEQALPVYGCSLSNLHSMWGGSSEFLPRLKLR